MNDANEKAAHQAKMAGAIEETPLTYYPENATRLRVKGVGKME